MQYDCEGLLSFIITNILTTNSLAGLKSTRTCAVRRRKLYIKLTTHCGYYCHFTANGASTRTIIHEIPI